MFKFGVKIRRCEVLLGILLSFIVYNRSYTSMTLRVDNDTRHI